MALSAFDDKAKPPTEADLAETLGRSYASWKRLKEAVMADFPGVEEEWGFASKSTGWGFRLKQGKRVILYMTPCRGHFLTSFVLGEKAVGAAREKRLPPEVMSAIEAAPKYAEGRGVRFETRTAEDVRRMRVLAGVKMES